jgi:hypothetical protein
LDWWNEVVKLKGQRLKTLARGESFEVVAVQDQAVIIRVLSTDNKRRVSRDEIESAFDELTARGEVLLTDIRKNRHSEANPTYVSAILASLPEVTHSVRPIRLRYKRPV